MSDAKKRLPVLKQTPEEEQGDLARPPWHWVGFGTCVTIGTWLPLSYVANLLTKKLLASQLGELDDYGKLSESLGTLSEGERGRVWATVLLPAAASYLVGCFVGGFIVGRWGGDNAGVREATIAGVAASLIVLVLSFASISGGNWWMSAVLIALAAGTSALGGKLGLRGRIKALTPNMR